MKILFKKAQYLLFAGLAFAAVSCDDDDNGNEIDNGNSIADIVRTDANFTILNAALEQTGLDATLDANGTFTVFAPTDAAFQALLDADPTDGLSTPADLLALPSLQNILLNHVLSTEIPSTALSDGYLKTLATDDGTNSGNALDLYVDLTSGVVLNGGPSVANPATDADIMADNGVVHIIDGVLTLPTIATLAAANPSFGNLVAALDQEGLVSAVSDVTGTYTVFAPLNTSFDALVSEDPLGAGWTGVGDILALGDMSASSTSVLDRVLTYHVIPNAAVRAEDIMNGQVVTTIETGTFTIDTSNGIFITDENGRSIEVIVTNVTAINGVVHAIDNVLLMTI